MFAFPCPLLALFTHPIISNQMKCEIMISRLLMYFLSFRFLLSIIYLAVSFAVYCIFLDFIITFFSSSFRFSFAHTGACAYLIIAIIEQNATLLTRVHCSFCCFVLFFFIYFSFSLWYPFLHFVRGAPVHWMCVCAIEMLSLLIRSI